MATFKIVVQYKRSDGFYTVYVRLTHNRKVMFIKTDKMVNDKGIVKGTKEVKDTFVINELMPTINKWYDKLNKVDSSKWSVSEVHNYLQQGNEDINFSAFAREYIDSLRDSLQPASIQNYECALNSLESYTNTNNIMYRQLTTLLISNWIKSLKDYRSCKFVYPLYIKRMFNEGLKRYNDYDNDITPIKNNPWLKITIPKLERPKKKAITMEECRLFFSLMPTKKALALALDVCKMILCLAGINVADLYSMRKKDYFDGILHYERRKTRTKRDDHAYIEMRVPDMLLPTLEKYFSTHEDEYLFYFHKRMALNTLTSLLNRSIKTLCKELHINEEDSYTPYTFRHTWATIAQNDLGASYEEIGFAMNHISTHKVTMGYVKPDFSRAWELNERLVEKIFFTNEKSKRLEEHHLPAFDEVEETFELRADAYFMGEVVAHVDGKGYHDTDEIIGKLMDSIKDGVPDRCTIQIKVANVTKGQTKFFERVHDALNTQK